MNATMAFDPFFFLGLHNALEGLASKTIPHRVWNIRQRTRNFILLPAWHACMALMLQNLTRYLTVALGDGHTKIKSDTQKKQDSHTKSRKSDAYAMATNIR